MLRVWVLVAILLTFLVPAKAATTVYGASVFAQSGTITNAAAGLGVTDGLTAAIARSSSLTLLLGMAATGSNVTVTGVRSGPGGSGTVNVALGAFVGGVPVFTANQMFPGAGGTATFDFSAGCAAISALGCPLLRVSVSNGAASFAFGLDGVSGVSAAPEPEAALLMLLAALGVGVRLKTTRRRGRARFMRA